MSYGNLIPTCSSKIVPKECFIHAYALEIKIWETFTKIFETVKSSKPESYSVENYLGYYLLVIFM